MGNRRARAFAGLSVVAFFLGEGLQLAGITNMTAAFGLWAAAVVCLSYSLWQFFRDWQEKTQRTNLLSLIRIGPNASLILSFIASAAALFLLHWWIAWSASDSRQNYAKVDRNGIPFEQGRAECEYQAKLASMNIQRDTDRFVEFFDLKKKCLRARGY